jgi:hypothetical protein
LTIQAIPVDGSGFLQTNVNVHQETRLRPAPQEPSLEDGTPVRLRISQTVSSADAHLNDRVDFEVLEDIKVSGVLIIAKGGTAWGTVTEAKHKRRLGRGGKLEIVMDSVRLVDGERATLRATREAQGGSHAGVITVGIVATGLIFWPVAPAFLFIHGKDITIPKGTEVPTFINGNFQLDLAKFQPPSPANMQPQTASSLPRASDPQADTNAQLKITSNPPGAEIELDGAFIGSTPSTVGASAGEHSISVGKSGFKQWERKIKVTSGTVDISADLEAEAQTSDTPK